jgi:thiol-disulfide isomerase/thioredoxin
MNNLIYLGSDDFGVELSSKGQKLLCNKQAGICLVLFFSNNCTYCDELIPDFKKLPMAMGGVKFALVNLNKHQQIYHMSKTTIAPIDVVPYIILYFNGKPFLKYEGERTLNDILAFMKEVVSRLQQQKSFVDNKVKTIESEIPKYTIGQPYNLVCDEDKGVCYINFGQSSGQPAAQQRAPMNQPQSMLNQPQGQRPWA